MKSGLDKYTYIVRHNPNCPSPFEIRTAGDAGFVEMHERRNLVTYGKTFDEAAARMLTAIRRREVERRRQFFEQLRERERRQVEHQFAGVMWA